MKTYIGILMVVLFVGCKDELEPVEVQIAISCPYDCDEVIIKLNGTEIRKPLAPVKNYESALTVNKGDKIEVLGTRSTNPCIDGTTTECTNTNIPYDPVMRVAIGRWEKVASYYPVYVNGATLPPRDVTIYCNKSFLQGEELKFECVVPQSAI